MIRAGPSFMRKVRLFFSFIFHSHASVFKLYVVGGVFVGDTGDNNNTRPLVTISEI